MATVEEQLAELRQVVEGMHGQIQRLNGELDQANTRAAEVDTRADEANERVLRALETVSSSGGKGKGNSTGGLSTLVDTRGIGRPDSFGKGTQQQLELLFPGWRRKTRNFLISWNPDVEKTVGLV